MTSKFDQIRPYENTDLPLVLNSLIKNKIFINALVAYRYAKWPRVSHPIIAFFIKRHFKTKLSHINNLRQFQAMLEPYMRRMIKQTTSALTTTGLDTLDLSKPCLFISNHRDIALDPAFVNWVLHTHKQDTVRIAVGDNLLSTDWVSDILRLNKCFIVLRSVEGRKEKLKAAKLLSEYIHHSLTSDQQHIWIAQREGRAKDGVDLTNPAILSMLLLNNPKQIGLSEYVTSLRIVPVAISYEFDPCDVSKAKELCQSEIEGNYNKPDNEDMRSIINGIKGQKGRVNVHFGKLANEQFSNTKEVAEFIDKEILEGYKIFTTNKLALARLQTNQTNSELSASLEKEINTKEASDYLNSRLDMLNKAQQEKLLNMYANPLRRQISSDS